MRERCRRPHRAFHGRSGERGARRRRPLRVPECLVRGDGSVLHEARQVAVGLRVRPKPVRAVAVLDYARNRRRQRVKLADVLAGPVAAAS